MGLVSPEIVQQLYGKWQELLNRNEGQALRKLSAWSRKDGFCLGQKAVDEKSNEITAIPELLDNIQIKGQIITIDAGDVQKAIAEKIQKNVRTMCLRKKKTSQGFMKM